MMRTVQLESVITCPICGHQATEQMPTDACQFFYVCTGCRRRLRPPLAVPARADGNGAQTITYHDTFRDSDYFEACGVPPETSISYNLLAIWHVTEGPNGQLHTVQRDVGAITVTTLDGQVVYTGRISRGGAFSDNDQNLEGSFVVNTIAHGSDGSTLNLHEIWRFNFSASGNLNEVVQINCGGDVTRPLPDEEADDNP